jgi:hypothetical protein
VPDQPDPRAYCPRCNQHGIRTYLEGGVRKYRTHPHVPDAPDGAPSCKNSGLEVQR